MSVALSNSTMQRNNFSSGSIVHLDYYCFPSLSKRSFSKVPDALTNKNESLGTKDGGKGNRSFFRSKNYWKRVKASAAHRRNSASNQASGRNSSDSRVSATKGDDMVISKDHLLADNKTEASLGLLSSSDGNGKQKPKAKGKTKQKSRSKGSNGQLFDASTAFDEANQQKASRIALKSKKPSVAESNQAAVDSEINSVKDTSIEAPEGSASTNDHLKPKGNESNMKRKIDKEASALVKTDAAVTDSSASRLSQSQKSEISSKNMPQRH